MVTGINTIAGWCNNYTANWTYNFGSSLVMGAAYLQAEDDASTNAHVIQFVDSGSPYNGDWQYVWAANATSITYQLASSGWSRAIALTFFFG